MHIVSHLRTIWFKGFDIDEDLPQKVIYTGPNTSGKSARAQAIALTIYGHIPFSTAGKRPSDILDSFGKDEIVTAITVDGMEFARKIYRSEKGVSTSFQVNKKRTSAPNFTALLGSKGNPKIANVAEFMAQSEAKKVDTLFDIYPVPELENIDQEIERAKAEISHITKKIEGAESTIQRLTSSKNQLVLPPGSISECQSEIALIDTQIAEMESQIKAAEIEDAAAKATAVEKQRAENEKMKVISEKDVTVTEQSFIDDDIPLKTDDDWQKSGIDSIPDSPEMAEADQVISRMENSIKGYQTFPCRCAVTPLKYEDYHAKPHQSNYVEHVISKHLEDKTDEITIFPEESIQRIIGALKGSGCTTCAALIVAKQELKKYGGS